MVSIFHPSTLNILLIDDDPLVLNLTSRLLRKLGAQRISLATSGSEGLEELTADNDPFDVIFCDLNMPEMDGVHFLRQLVKTNFTGGLAFLSGEDERMLETAFELAHSLDINCLGTIPKPQLRQERLSEILDKLSSPRISPSAKTQPQQETQPCLITPQELEDGLAQDAIVLYYQPKIRVSTGLVGGVEALMRWKHPVRGILSPNFFLPVAEMAGKLNEMTSVIYKQAMHQMAEWRKIDIEPDISINISVNTFMLPDFATFLINNANKHANDPGKIILEITETEAMNDAMSCLETLMHLRMKRFGLSVDDFGTGHSSMAKLKQIPFTELKIDRSFVQNAEKNSSSRAILESSVELARKFRMNIVAEGVESRSEWELVKALGCDYVQGYYCSQPMPGDQLPDFIAKGSFTGMH